MVHHKPMPYRFVQQPFKISVIIKNAALAAALLTASFSSAIADGIVNSPGTNGPEAELHIGRLVFGVSNAYRWGPGRPWWRIDWPEAEFHFSNGVSRYTSVEVAPDSVHLTLINDAIFDYPWVFAQQVGRWRLNDKEVSTLGEYLKRGGFLIVDDFHGPAQWQNFFTTIKRALPNHAIVDIPFADSLLTIQYDMNQRTQISGRRHIQGFNSDGQAIVRMPHSPPEWKGIYDSSGRLMVAINFNMDIGDAWEHANDPDYPNNMTSFAYRLGINYVIYAMTH